VEHSRILKGKVAISKGNSFLSSDFRDALRKAEGLQLTEAFPGRKPTRFTIVSVVGQVKLGSDEQDLAIEAVSSTVVAHPTFFDG
jgi:hypothetical protein